MNQSDKSVQILVVILIKIGLNILGLLHHLHELDGDEKPLFEDVELIESLLTRCSSAPNLETRQEAALQLLQELTFENENDESTESDDNIGEEDNGKDAYEEMQDGPPDGDLS